MNDFEELKRLVVDYIDKYETYLPNSCVNSLYHAQMLAYERLKEWVKQNT